MTEDDSESRPKRFYELRAEVALRERTIKQVITTKGGQRVVPRHYATLDVLALESKGLKDKTWDTVDPETLGGEALEQIKGGSPFVIVGKGVYTIVPDKSTFQKQGEGRSERYVRQSVYRQDMTRKAR